MEIEKVNQRNPDTIYRGGVINASGRKIANCFCILIHVHLDNWMVMQSWTLILTASWMHAWRVGYQIQRIYYLTFGIPERQWLHQAWSPMWTQRGESPLSFCNGLGTIYIASSWGKTFFILLPEIWVRSLGIVLGRC